MAANLFGPPLATAPVVVGAGAAGASRRDAVWEAKRAARLQGAFPGPAAMEPHAAPSSSSWPAPAAASVDAPPVGFTRFVPSPRVVPAARSPLQLPPEPALSYAPAPAPEPEPSYAFGGRAGQQPPQYDAPASNHFSFGSGPAPARDDFAFAREVANGGAAPSHHSGDGFVAGRGARPSKESYAADLERQMEAKRAAAAASREREKADAARMHAEMHRALPVRDEADVFGRAKSKSPGRGGMSPRGGGAPPSSYADALEQQIAAKAEAARREKAADRRAANAAMGLADVLVTNNERGRPLVPHAGRDDRGSDEFSYVLGRRPQPAHDAFNRPASAADGVAVSHMSAGEAPPYVRRVSSASILGAAAARVVADGGGAGIGALGGVGERERAGRQRAVKESYADELRRQMAEQESSKRRSRIADLSPQFVPPSRHAARAGGSPIRVEEPSKWAYAGGTSVPSAASPRAYAAPAPAPPPALFTPQSYMPPAPQQQQQQPMMQPMAFLPQMQQQAGGFGGYPAPQMIAIPVPYPVPMPSNAMPQYGAPGGMFGAPPMYPPPAPAPPAAHVNFIPHLPLESERTAAAAPMHYFGSAADDTPGPGRGKDSKASYAAALEEQIAQGQARKQSEKARLAADDVRLEREIAAHEARVAARKQLGGAGDPVRDDMGHIVAVRGTRKSGGPPGGLASGGDSPYGVAPVSPPGDPHTGRFWPDGDRPNIMLGGRGSPTLDPAEMKARQLAENAAALEAQIADKAARKRKEAADHAALEAAEEARIARERAEIERKFQEEEAAARAKLEAERRSVLDAQIASKHLSKEAESRREKEEEAKFDAKIKRQQAEMAAAFEAEQRRAAGLPPLPPATTDAAAPLSPTGTALVLAAPVDQPLPTQLFAPASPQQVTFPPFAPVQHEPAVLLRKHEEEIALLRAEMAALHVRAGDAAFMSGLERVGLTHPSAPPPPVYSGIPSMSTGATGDALGLSAPPVQSLRAGFAHEGGAGSQAPMPPVSHSHGHGHATAAGIMDDSAYMDTSPVGAPGRSSPAALDMSLPSGSSMRDSAPMHRDTYDDAAAPQHADSPVLPRKVMSRVPSASQQELLSSMHGDSLFIVPGTGFEAGGQAFNSTLQRLAAVMETEDERAADGYTAPAPPLREPSPPPGMAPQPYTSNNMQVADAVHRALTQPPVVDAPLRNAAAMRPSSATGSDDIIRAIDGILAAPDDSVLASSLVAGENAFMQSSMEDGGLNESYAPPEFMRVSAALPRQLQQQQQQRAPAPEPVAPMPPAPLHAPPADDFNAEGEETMQLRAIQRHTEARMRALDGGGYGGYMRPESQASRTSATPADMHPSAWVRNVLDQQLQQQSQQMLQPPPMAASGQRMMRWREGIDQHPAQRSPLTVSGHDSYTRDTSYAPLATIPSTPPSEEEHRSRHREREGDRRRDRTVSASSRDSEQRDVRRDTRRRDEEPRRGGEGRRREAERSRSRHRSQSRPRRRQHRRDDDDDDASYSDGSDSYVSSRRRRDEPRRGRDDRQRQPRRGEPPTSDSDMNPIGPDERGRRERSRTRGRGGDRRRSRSRSSEERARPPRHSERHAEREREVVRRPARDSEPARHREHRSQEVEYAAPPQAAPVAHPPVASPLVLPDEPIVLQASMPVFPLPQGGAVYAQSVRGDRSRMLDGPSEYLRMR